jgi:mRNA-degrading endonuclease HigB of HigAB toxin-antitoxin module
LLCGFLVVAAWGPFIYKEASIPLTALINIVSQKQFPEQESLKDAGQYKVLLNNNTNQIFF